jgi:pimeloyl-ACP methyl ester carboxylesterase
MVGLVIACLLALVASAGAAFYGYVRWRYFDHIIRIFQEKPLFIIPRGEPNSGATELMFDTEDGFSLHGCYFRAALTPRRGVILFGLEYGSNCWACLPYCDHLIQNGFDVFTFEPRNCGASQHQPGYESLQWITSFEVLDFQAALAYLRGRGDADPRGVGFFGISKGGGAGVIAGSRDPYIRCFVTDGIFGTHTTMVPYMYKWVNIYNKTGWLQALLPLWFYGFIGRDALRTISRQRGCRFPHLERALARLSPRPLFMIHGGEDTYIKPDMAQALYERANPPKEFWPVEGAKHNQAITVAGEEYRRRVLDFFVANLTDSTCPALPPALAAAQ